MRQSRRIFCDADIWIKFCKVHKPDILLAVYDEIFFADKVVAEIKNYRGLSRAIWYLDGYLKNRKSKIKQVDFSDFNPEQQATITSGFAQILQIEFVGSDERKNYGEIYTALYAQEMGIDIMVSDDRDAKEVIEDYFDLQVKDHYEVLYLAIEMRVLSSQEAEQIYNQIENLPGNTPKSVTFAEMMRIVQNRLTA
ncbi:hypothetical protein D478_07249 [Brevibacillus agri BAB-2500]|nr:hypothetical protein D478_07249 [Brevibacillus agri BAB-2500]